MGNMHLVTGYAGREHVTAADHGAFHTALFGSGQFVLNLGNKLAASSPSNNTVRILDGDLLMQGRHVRLNEGTYVDLTIDSGAQGYYRNDLIVARYTRNESTGVEEVNLVVIKGTAAASNPADPAYTSGDLITDHAILNDMPLYRVSLNGLVVENLIPLFTALEVNIPALLTMVNEHFHSTDDIKNGILPVSRGGTGVASLAALGDAIGNTRTAHGSYVGTGTFGQVCPNSLTFDFEPKAVIVRPKMDQMNRVLLAIKGVNYCGIYDNQGSSQVIYFDWGDKSVSWYYNGGEPHSQLNSADTTYHYIAIG